MSVSQHSTARKKYSPVNPYKLKQRLKEKKRKIVKLAPSRRKATHRAALSLLYQLYTRKEVQRRSAYSKGGRVRVSSLAQTRHINAPKKLRPFAGQGKENKKLSGLSSAQISLGIPSIPSPLCDVTGHPRASSTRSQDWPASHHGSVGSLVEARRGRPGQR